MDPISLPTAQWRGVFRTPGPIFPLITPAAHIPGSTPCLEATPHPGLASGPAS